MARAAGQRRSLPHVDSHLHLWTPDTENFPADVAPSEHLNKDRRATHENFVTLMDQTGVSHAVVVQPVNYGQDYGYLLSAMDAHPKRLRGMFVADPSVPASEASAWVERRAKSHAGWVGLRFNPYKWPADRVMSDDTGVAMFRLSRHAADIEKLLTSSPVTQVIIDHWGFFLQPATGSGEDRLVDEESWQSLLRLAAFKQAF
ncbi:unnamed protein product, partial [Polarella glacialis]